LGNFIFIINKLFINKVFVIIARNKFKSVHFHSLKHSINMEDAMEEGSDGEWEDEWSASNIPTNYNI
jgi:hypothetical protein